MAPAQLPHSGPDYSTFGRSGQTGRSARADMLCGAALWALRTPCIVKSRISGKDADTRHQFWEPALSHGCPQVAPAVTHWSQQGPFGDPAGFHHRVKAFFQPLDSTI